MKKNKEKNVLIEGLTKGDFKTRLSYIIMGAGCFLNGQLVRGLSYLTLEIFFIVFMIFSGWNGLMGLQNLGVNVTEEVFDPDRGIYVYTHGDNSMLILLFGVVVIALIVGFIYLYYQNIKNAYQNQEDMKQGKPLNKFKDDINDLKNGKYHITILVIPMALTLIFTVLPLMFMILIAFTNFDAAHQPPGNLFTWVGLANFKELFAGGGDISTTFFALLQWTFIWAIFATFLNFFLGMLLAILINKKGIKLKKMWRTIFVLTIAIPQFVSLMLMSKMLADAGPVNALLEMIGMAPIPFLSNPLAAKITVIVVNCWVGIPYTMLITSGILMNIPQDMYESADIDGASAWTKFRKITLPYMLFVLAPYLLTQFVGNLNNFNVIFLLTGGGPLTQKYYQAGETDLLVTWLYKITMTEKNYAMASTLGIVIFLITATLSLVVFDRILKKQGGFNR